MKNSRAAIGLAKPRFFWSVFSVIFFSDQTEILLGYIFTLIILNTRRDLWEKITSRQLLAREVSVTL